MSDLSPTRKPGDVPLTQGQKAAIIIHLLLAGGADPGLKSLPPAQQRRIVREMASLRFVDRETLAKVVAEFAGELDDIGLHFPRDMGKVLANLDGQLSQDVLEQLLADLDEGEAPENEAVWEQIAAMAPDDILAIMQSESDEICAILLSKLPAVDAAKLLGQLPEARGPSIAAAFARTEGVNPAAISRIGIALGRQAAAVPVAAFADDAVSRIGGILNAATSGVRAEVMASLDGSDPDFAARVRAAVFSFENIPERLDPRDVPKALRGVDNAQMVAALGGAPDGMAKVVDFIMSSISSRLAEQLKEDIQERGSIPQEDAEAAMSAIVGEIRRLEEAGEIVLVAPES
ncbi:MAG: FliG C-terminal domain-containing protein [Pseudomonadota bacterium]